MAFKRIKFLLKLLLFKINCRNGNAEVNFPICLKNYLLDDETSTRSFKYFYLLKIVLKDHNYLMPVHFISYK